MDIWVLTRVVDCLDAALRGAVLEDAAEEWDGRRVRLSFRKDERGAAIAIGLGPGPAWIGRPQRPRIGRPGAGPLLAGLRRRLNGVRLEGVERVTRDRRVTLLFADGQVLAAELAGSASNLVHLDSAGRVVASFRKTRSARARLRVGEPYEAPRAASRLDPFAVDPGEIDRSLAEHRELSLARALRAVLLGVEPATAGLLASEAAVGGGTPGEVVVSRAERLGRGELDPVVESASEPLDSAERGELGAEEITLLPWEPSTGPVGGRQRYRRADPAGTAGLYHEAVDAALWRQLREEGLLGILTQEIRRLSRAAEKARADARTFDDPERYQRWGEALLAGLARAERSASGFRVPDPWDEQASWLAVPASAGQSPQQAASAHFERHRRATRGLARARARTEELTRRRGTLQSLADEARAGRDIVNFEQRMRDEGIPVGLEPTRKAARAATRHKPRPEGVRMFVTGDGLTAMVGKTARDNQRLTFKLAAPDDFWFHALGVTGAHVVVRNEKRGKRPPKTTLEQAAAAAAWFSEARAQGNVDVQWTRRKYVRKVRGGAPGAVLVKRSETVRVRPRLPSGLARTF